MSGTDTAQILAEAPLCWGQHWPWDDQQRPVEERSPGLLQRSRIELRRNADLAARRPTPRLLRRALERLVARHEVLRSTFEERDGEPVQQVWSARAGMFELHVLGPDATLAEVDALAAAPMDVATAWPIRVVVAAPTRRTVVVEVTVHHIATDLASLRTICQELAAILTSLAWLRPVRLPDVGLQPREIAAFERSPDGAARNERAMRHWLDNRPDLEMMLGTLRGRFEEPSQEMHVARAESVLAAEGLADLVVARRASNAAVVTAAAARVLAETLGCVNVPMYMMVSNRHRPEMSRSVASVAQAGLVVVRGPADAAFEDLVPATSRSILGALRHGHYDGTDLTRRTSEFVGFGPTSPVALPSMNVIDDPLHPCPEDAEAYEESGTPVRSWRVGRPCRGFNFHVSAAGSALAVELRVGTHLLRAEECRELVARVVRTVESRGRAGELTTARQTSGEDPR